MIKQIILAFSRGFVNITTNALDTEEQRAAYDRFLDEQYENQRISEKEAKNEDSL